MYSLQILSNKISIFYLKATILTIHLLVGHYSTVQWAARPIRRCLPKPLFWRFGHQTSTTSGSIGRATDIACLQRQIHS
ncbi:hypothetical protein ACB092_04G020500 [Castanea dentata]